MATTSTQFPHPAALNTERAPLGPFGSQGQNPPAPREGDTARAIEHETSRLPSDTFLWGALGAMGLAMLLQGTNKKHASLFVGQWAAPLLLFGVYNKLVKLGGSDRYER